MPPRVLVIGAGAIGGVLASGLIRAGADVTALEANRKHANAISGEGLHVDELGVAHRTRIPSACAVGELSGQFDFGLITLKSIFIEDAIGPLVAGKRVHTYVSLGNGLVQGRIAALTGAESLVIGTVEWGATNIGPGVLAQTTRAPIVVGESSGVDSDRLQRLAGVLQGSSEVRVSSNIYGQVWSKLLLNSALSGLGAISGLIYADIVGDKTGKALALELWSEGVCVAEACGISLEEVAGMDPYRPVVSAANSKQEAGAALEELMVRLGPTRASMLQDLDRGVLTEVDVINGGVVASGTSVGIQDPLNEGIVKMIHECELGIRKPEISNLLELRERA